MIKSIYGLLEYIDFELKKQCDIAIVGMSGGADSTLVTTLCTKALEPENVYTLHMPYSQTDVEAHNAESKRISYQLKVPQDQCLTVTIHKQVDLAIECLPEHLSYTVSDVVRGNIKARERMKTLYSIANIVSEKYPRRKVRVMGTGNLSEDFIGYDTKGGDALADIFPIGELYKSEVYQLLDYFAEKGVLEKDMINRVPSANLWDGQTDEQELGFTYKQMEKAIRKIKQKKSLVFNACEEFVLKRHVANKHKHEAPTVFDVRSFCD